MKMGMVLGHKQCMHVKLVEARLFFFSPPLKCSGDLYLYFSNIPVHFENVHGICIPLNAFQTNLFIMHMHVNSSVHSG